MSRNRVTRSRWCRWGSAGLLRCRPRFRRAPAAGTRHADRHLGPARGHGRLRGPVLLRDDDVDSRHGTPSTAGGHRVQWGLPGCRDRSARRASRDHALASAQLLASEYPAVQVDPDPIFIHSSERVWTAAGVTAGIDLALALVEEDHGTELAQSVARWLVLHLRRPGGQSQFAPPVWMPRARRRPIRDVQDAIENDPAAPHPITDLAAIAAMSPRHFTRVFTAEVGESPGVYVERIRTDAARRHLEESDDPMPVVAARSGFGSAETMRRVFSRRVGISPDRYRRSCR